MSNPARLMIRDLRGRFLRKVDGPPQVRATHVARRLMLRRWRRGVDQHGRKMAPYARSTRRQKRREGKPSAPANLVDTGRMIGGVGVRKKSSSPAYRFRAEMYLRSSRSRRLMRLHTRGAGRLPRRDPWGLTRQERRVIARRYEGEVRRRIPRQDRRRAVTVQIGIR